MQALKSSPWTGFAIILALAAGLRFYAIGQESLWIDELRTWYFASAGWDRVWVEYPQYDVHPPLYFALTKIWIAMFGDSEGAMRSLAALFSLGALSFVYLAARQVAGPARPWPALAAALVFAMATQQIHYAQEVRFYAALTMAFSMVVYGTVWFLKHPDAITKPIQQGLRDGPTRTAYIVLALGSALLMWFHTLGALYNIALAVVLGVWWLSDLKRAPTALINIILVVALAILIYSPNLANMLGWLFTTHEGGYWLVTPSLERLAELFAFTYGFEQPYANKIDFALTALVCGVAAAGAYGLYRARESRVMAALIVLAVLPFTLSTLLTYLVQPTLLDRTLLPMFAPWAILIGASLFNRFPFRLEWVAIGVIAVAYAAYAADYYRDERKENWRDVVAYVDVEAEADEPVFLLNNIVQLAFDYYLRDTDTDLDIRPLPEPFPISRDAYTYPIGGRSEPMLSDAMAREIWADTASSAQRIWMVARSSFRFVETPNYPEDYFARHSDCLMSVYPERLGIVIYRYDDPSEQARHATPSCGFDGDNYVFIEQ